MNEIGITGKIVDLFNKELTQDEWNALAIVHKMRLRLNLGIQFNWAKSIDVKSEYYSQIVDESVFLEKEKNNHVKCPFCAKEMNSFELTHYKCKKCNEYFTN